MLRLLFCTVAILPIGIVPWMTSKADTLDVELADATYAELVADPSLAALSDCETGELPIFFHDQYVTTHSAEFIIDAVEAADDCGEVEVTIIPVLPEYADADIERESVARTAQLAEYVDATARVTQADIRIDISEAPFKDDISTLYINGRAAILRIDPEEG